MFPCAEYRVRQKLCSAHCAGENRRIQFEAGLAPRALPLLCGCSLVRNTERGRSFVRHIAPEKTAESDLRRVLHLGHSCCSVDVPLCGIRSAAEALFGTLRRRKPQNPIRGGPCPLGHRAPLSSFSCVEQEARQKKHPPRSQRLRGGCCYFIRRGTAAGTRAGCSSPLRTAKRRRRERACPCRSR